MHALVLDASLRQALVAARSLGRAGLSVTLVEGRLAAHRWGAPAFSSRWAVARATVTDVETSPGDYTQAVLDLASETPDTVIIPCGDQSLAALRRRRADIERRALLAVGSEPALAVAVDKVATLELARQLGIAVPPTRQVTTSDEVADAMAEVGFPAVVKPPSSWDLETGGSRLESVAVVNRTEAEQAIHRLLDAGLSAHVQPWLTGRREAVSLLRSGGEVVAAFAQASSRTSPALGGASVIRRSLPLDTDVHRAALALIESMGLDGPSDVEFRRDSEGRPYLMEVNPRLNGSLELAVRAGVDFPLMMWQWARGLPVDRSPGYRVGLQMRWLTGDLRWLGECLRRPGRPDAMTRRQALGTFARSFAAPQLYDMFDREDPMPVLAELARITAKHGIGAGRRGAGYPRAAHDRGPLPVRSVSGDPH